MNQIPQIGERWQYLDEFIIEITSVDDVWDGKMFQGIIVQVLPGSFKISQWGPKPWQASGKSGGYVRYMQHWTFLEGQHKPTYQENLQSNPNSNA